MPCEVRQFLFEFLCDRLLHCAAGFAYCLCQVFGLDALGALDESLDKALKLVSRRHELFVLACGLAADSTADVDEAFQLSRRGRGPHVGGYAQEAVQAIEAAFHPLRCVGHWTADFVDKRLQGGRLRALRHKHFERVSRVWPALEECPRLLLCDVLGQLPSDLFSLRLR